MIIYYPLKENFDFHEAQLFDLCKSSLIKAVRLRHFSILKQIGVFAYQCRILFVGGVKSTSWRILYLINFGTLVKSPDESSNTKPKC